MTSIEQLLAPAASTVDDQDWSDVLARAGMPRRERRVVASLVALVALALLATAAARLHGAGAAPIPGPTHVERRVANGTVHWLVAHEPRGTSLIGARVAPLRVVGNYSQRVRYTRVVVVGGLEVAIVLRGGPRDVCLTVVDALPDIGSCGFWTLRPFTSLTLSEMAPQDSLVFGLASDDVARLRLYLPHGRSRPVPLVDNVFALRFPSADSRYNLVAYDRAGRVIGLSR
jgi:hypothetical protein